MTFGARNIDCAPDVLTVKSMDWLEIMFEVEEIAQVIETIAGQAINLCEPENLDQAKDNLKGLKTLIESACKSHGIE